MPRRRWNTEEERRALRKAYRKKFYWDCEKYGRKGDQRKVMMIFRPPDEVLAERDLAFSQHQSATAVFCGDPPFGRSALERKQAKETS